MSTNAATPLDLSDLRLIDHHCHGVITTNLDRLAFEEQISESSRPAAAGCTRFDTQVGFAIRRYCAPALGLEPFASPEDYLARREEWGAERVNETLLGASNISVLGIETGHVPVDIAGIPLMKRYADADAFEIVRLEKIAEEVAVRTREAGSGTTTYFDDVLTELDARMQHAAGVKSIAAYRIGLDFDPERPTTHELQSAIAEWFNTTGDGSFRLAHPVIIRALIWSAIDRKTALQFHIGYGDDDVDLHRCNPLLLTELLRATADTGARFMLLHCYPFHREAGYLADVFPHVYCDVGLAINYTGARSTAIIAESLELTPFHKALFSSDAFGVAELYYTGTILFRAGLGALLGEWISEAGWPEGEALRVANMIGSENALRAYGLE